MVYRYTKNPVFLKFAEKVTDAYLRRLIGHNDDKKTADILSRKDLVPKWDFDDPDPKASKDASAACVVADALLELSQYVGNDKGKHYHDIAVATLAQLSTPAYLSGKRNDSFSSTPPAIILPVQRLMPASSMPTIIILKH